jgi:hypothetical protein
MRILKALPIVSGLLIFAMVGCVQDRAAKNDTSTAVSSNAENSTGLTPTSDRPGEPHIYSNATSRAVSPPLDEAGKSSTETP